MVTRSGLSDRLRRGVDRIRGLDYLETVRAEEVGLDPTEVHPSSASSATHLRPVLRSLGDVSSSSVLDIGAGKGQAMRTLRSFPFERVDGIELSPELVTVARRNLRGRAATRSTVFEGDARTFDGYGSYQVLYLYNPFPEAVMGDVVAQIARQITGPITVVYNAPRCEDQLIAGLDLVRTAEHPGSSGNVIAVYRSR